MSERRPLGELLRDEALYEAGAPESPGGRWRERLLAARFARRLRSRRPPAAALPPVMRLILLVAAPAAALLIIALAFALGPAPFAGAQGLIERLVPSAPAGGAAAPPSGGVVAHWVRLPPFVWPLLVAASAGLTFLVRRRLPRFIPLDW